MNTIRKDTHVAIDLARRAVLATIDVAEVPDGHPVERKVHAAFISLEEAMREISTVGRNASVLEHEGPVVRVFPKKDMRNWPTSSGKTASEIIPSSQRSRVANSRRKVTASGRFATRRFLSSREYLQALEEAVLIGSPLSSHNSNSLTQLALN